MSKVGISVERGNSPHPRETFSTLRAAAFGHYRGIYSITDPFAGWPLLIIEVDLFIYLTPDIKALFMEMRFYPAIICSLFSLSDLQRPRGDRHHSLQQACFYSALCFQRELDAFLSFFFSGRNQTKPLFITL